MSTQETATAPKSDATLPADAPADGFDGMGEHPKCDACKIGLLYPIAYDPDATHEAQPNAPEGNPTGHPHFAPSGGAVRVTCFNCGRGSSHPLNEGSA